MKLLMVTSSLPSPRWGAGTRSYYLLKTLADKCSVSLLVSKSDAGVETREDRNRVEQLGITIHRVESPVSQAKRFQQLVSLLRGKSYILNSYSLTGVQKALDAVLAQDHYDVVLFESVFLAGCHLPPGVKVVIDQHNIEHELLERTYRRAKAGLRKWYNWRESRLLKAVEIERCRRADLVLVTSERERRVLKEMLPESLIEVVPNGVDVEAFRRNSSEGEVAGQIVYTGTMHYYPNVDAVLSFAQRCWPLIRAQVPDASWQIVGSHPSPAVQRLADLPGVTVAGSVPNIRPYLATPAVAIVPLRIGSGTRLKILEALAMGKAVVSTSLGCEGLAVEPGKHLIVADQPEAFARAVVELISSPEKREALGCAGRALVEAKYGWERCGDQLLSTLEKMDSEGRNGYVRIAGA